MAILILMVLLRFSRHWLAILETPLHEEEWYRPDVTCICSSEVLTMVSQSACNLVADLKSHSLFLCLERSDDYYAKG